MSTAYRPEASPVPRPGRVPRIVLRASSGKPGAMRQVCAASPREPAKSSRPVRFWTASPFSEVKVTVWRRSAPPVSRVCRSARPTCREAGSEKRGVGRAAPGASAAPGSQAPSSRTAPATAPTVRARGLVTPS
ncbi:hypothetical protein C5L38_24605 [Streptomyces sp. WAC00288]|nr:hypothetical protein C5L38_24605 [Streptomyces sp. WAC00288]